MTSGAHPKPLDDRAAPPPGGSSSAENEARLDLIINTIPAMAWSATPDGMLDFCNRHFLDFVGLRTEDIMGTGFQRIFHPDDKGHLLSAWQEIMATGRARAVDGRIRRADGCYRWFTLRQNPLRDASGQLRKWYGVVVDIEDRKRAEEALTASETALRESERALNLIINTMPAMAWSAMPDGTLDFWNQHFLDFVGLPFDQIAGTGFYRIFHPDDLEWMRSSWEETLATKRPKEVDGRIQRADGEYRWFTLRQSPLLDADGNVVKWYGIVVDIEDRKRAEEKLRQAQADLAHAARMMTMGELAVCIAHEVNQPLTAIVTNAGTCLRWLASAPPDLDRARQAAERIVRDGHRAGDIVAGIRALARKSAPRMEPVDLRRLTQEVLDLLRGEFQRHAVVARTEFSRRAIVVRGDATQLQQVVLNLVMNAVEAMAQDRSPREAGGGWSVTVRTDLVGDAVEISVRDTGPGLGKANRARLFEAFYGTRPEGLGLGLAICRSIVEAHGGRIRAADNTPHGSVFTVTLPLAGGVAGEAAGERAASG